MRREEGEGCARSKFEFRIAFVVSFVKVVKGSVSSKLKTKNITRNQHTFYWVLCPCDLLWLCFVGCYPSKRRNFIEMSKYTYSTANLTDTELKEQGNRLFEQRKYDDAVSCYTKAIVRISSYFSQILLLPYIESSVALNDLVTTH